MSDVLQRLFDLLLQWLRFLIPFFLLGDDQVGLIRRFGVYKRDLKAGWNWKWPIIEETFAETSALDSTVLREQTLTTSDGEQVTLRGVVTYRVVNPRKYILDCATAISVMNDVGCCVLAEMVPTLSSDTVLRSDEFHREFLRRVRLRAKRWGVYVDSVGVIDRVKTPTYRIITSASKHDEELAPLKGSS